MDRLSRARALARAGLDGAVVLGDVPPAALVALAERVRVIELPAGAAASTRRYGTDFVLVVAAGAVRDDRGRAYGEGALVGVHGALAGGEPIALVVERGATLVEISVDDFLDVLVEHAAASAALARALESGTGSGSGPR